MCEACVVGIVALVFVAILILFLSYFYDCSYQKNKKLQSDIDCLKKEVEKLDNKLIDFEEELKTTSSIAVANYLKLLTSESNPSNTKGKK